MRELLLDLKRRGLAVAPELAIADGALGFWKAIEEVWPRTRSQRCWVHQTANVLNKLPKSQHSKAKRALQEISGWPRPGTTQTAPSTPSSRPTPSSTTKAATCLVKDRETMLAFYDFPAEHWKHLRTTNPIESTFATVRHLPPFDLDQAATRERTHERIRSSSDWLKLFWTPSAGQKFQVALRRAFPSRSLRPIPQALLAADAQNRADRFDFGQFPEIAAQREGRLAQG